MGLENAPKPKTNTDLSKKLPEVKVESKHPDDVRQLREKKQEASKDVLAKLPGGKTPQKTSETYEVKSLTPEQKKKQSDLMDELTDIDIDENDKLSKVKIAGAEEPKTYEVKSLTPEQKKKQADLMDELTDIDIDEDDKLSKVKIAGAEEPKKHV